MMRVGETAIAICEFYQFFGWQIIIKNKLCYALNCVPLNFISGSPNSQCGDVALEGN